MTDSEPMKAARLAEDLRRFPAVVIADALGGENVLPPSISAVVVDEGVAGPAYTVLMVPGDNLALHLAVANARPGDIIVAACRDENPFGVWGGILSLAAKQAGVAA